MTQENKADDMSDDRALPMPDEIWALRCTETRNVPEGTPNPDFLWLAYEQAPEGYPQYTRYTRADTAHDDLAGLLDMIPYQWELRKFSDSYQLAVLCDPMVHGEGKTPALAIRAALEKVKG